MRTCVQTFDCVCVLLLTAARAGSGWAHSQRSTLSRRTPRQTLQLCQGKEKNSQGAEGSGFMSLSFEQPSSDLLPQASKTPLSVARASSDTPVETLLALLPLLFPLLPLRVTPESKPKCRCTISPQALLLLSKSFHSTSLACRGEGPGGPAVSVTLVVQLMHVYRAVTQHGGV